MIDGVDDGHDDDDDENGDDDDGHDDDDYYYYYSDDDDNGILPYVAASFKQIIYIYPGYLARKLNREVLVFFLHD